MESVTRVLGLPDSIKGIAERNLCLTIGIALEGRALKPRESTALTSAEDLLLLRCGFSVSRIEPQTVAA
ncbi:hypothetical protein RRG08_064818, partial [Elysia crispata]